MSTLHSETRSVRLGCGRDTAFAFLADPANLPKWAIHFCRGIGRDEEGWRVETANGEVGLRVTTDEETGVIDYEISPVPGVWLPARSRVIPNGEGSEYVFTQHRFPDLSEEAFAAQVGALEEELEVLAKLLRPAGRR